MKSLSQTFQRRLALSAYMVTIRSADQRREELVSSALLELTVLIWLASYPRSGNTLVRQILRQVFGLESFSQYNDPKDISARPDVAALVGHVQYDVPWSEFVASARASEKPAVVKTHDPPQDDSTAIYIVRDGRAATVSYYHFLRDFRCRTDMTIERVIDGDTRFGSWSAHLDAWKPLTRPATLLVRFEDLLGNPATVVDSLAPVLGLAPRGSWRNEIDLLQRLFPVFFRGGSNARNIDELSEAQRSLFWKGHAAWMERLGYRHDDDTPEAG